MILLAGCPSDGQESGNSNAEGTSTPTGASDPDDGTATAPQTSANVSTGSDPSDSTGQPGTTSKETTGSGSGNDDNGSSSSSSGGDTMGIDETQGVRFVSFGDAGEGNEAQQMVANAAEVVCEDRGCDFALMLGDNFYDVGVTSVTDQQFIDKFENVYAGLEMPFYVVLGNHDYGDFANDWARGEYQIEYSDVSDKWTMPHYWYTFSSESGGTQFFAFDTARMMWNHDVADQRDWMETEMAASKASWKVAIGHHPYISNGQHGNAGNYEGIPGLPVVSGEYVKDFIDDFVCGQAQVYISGHDHNRQAFDPVCGTYFLVSGAAAKTSDFEFRDDNPTLWGDDTVEGFLWMEIVGDMMTAAFYDFDGNLDHEMIANL